MSFLWHGLTEQGSQVPIQVDAQGRVIAVDATPEASNWSRTGTTLSPAIAGDSVDIGSGNITLNADGSAALVGKATSASTADTDPGTTLATKDYVDSQSGGGGAFASCYIRVDYGGNRDAPNPTLFLESGNNVSNVEATGSKGRYKITFTSPANNNRYAGYGWGEGDFGCSVAPFELQTNYVIVECWTRNFGNTYNPYWVSLAFIAT